MSDHSSQVPSIEKLAELLPQYGIDSFIAMGGMGAVYKGRQLSLERDVAIKVLLNQYGEDAVFKESFTTEAKAMARLNHSNLLGVFDYGDIEGMPFIVMEYVEGGSLHEAAWNTAIEPTQAVEIINGICKGLANAHENGIIHRDIKPANILLTLKAVPKVADFGLAHAHDSGDSGLNMGTPGFTAPEVFNDPNQAGQLADIYSVGVIFHQLLTGIDPTGSMEPPSHPTGRLHLDAIWRKATHINPKQRYKNLSEMSTDLEKWSDSKLAAPAVSQTQTNYTPNYTPSRPVQTNAGGGILGKVVIIFVLLGGLALTFQLIKEKESATNQNMVDSSQDNDVVIPVDGSIPGLDPIPYPTTDPIPKTPDPVVTTVPDPNIDTKTKPEIVKKKKAIDPVTPPIIKTKPELEKDLPPGDPELRERAIGFIQDARKKRDGQLDRLGASQRGSIIKSYTERIKVIRDAYVFRLKEAAAETSDAQLKPRLLSQAERAKDLDAWIALLAPEEKLEITENGGASVVGKWDQYTNEEGGKISRWIAHANGRMEIVGKNWEVTWKLLEDGTLSVDWNKKKPYLFTRDGEGGWIGKTTFGQHTTLKRGNW